MAAGAAELVLRCVFNGSLSLNDMNIERRPYHRNCSCALHKQKGVCSNACDSQRNTISFPKKQSSTDKYCMSMASSKWSSQSSLLINEASFETREGMDQALYVYDTCNGVHEKVRN